MIPALVLAWGLAAATAGDAPPTVDLSAYAKVKDQVGPGAAAQVKLAMWCEAHGLSAERLKHLAVAVLADPKNAAARGLLGLVEFNGKWERPEAVATSVRADESLAAALAEYNARRDRTPPTADAQWKLALWCESHGLTAESQAHLAEVVRLDPSRDAAWKRLGCKKVGGRWVSEAQLAAEKAEADAQKAADREWKSTLEKLRTALSSRHEEKRRAAERALAEVVEPRAVPAVWAEFVIGKHPNHARAVGMLGRIDAVDSSRALAMLAVFDDDPEVRRASTETLKRRDPREFASLLVPMLRKPVKYEVRPVGGPGSPGAIFIGGEKANIQRVYAPPAIPYIPVPAGAQLSYDMAGLPVFTGVSAPTSTTRTVTSGPQLHVYLSQLPRFNPSDPATARAVADYRANAGRIWSDFYATHPNNARLRQKNPTAADSVQGVNIGNATTTTTVSQRIVQVPVGRIIAEYQKAALSAQQQLEADVAALDAMNAEIRDDNGRVAGVLRDVSGKALGESVEAWDAWWVDLQGYAYTPEPERPKPTYYEPVSPSYVPQPVPTLSAIESQSTSTTGLRVTPVSSVVSCFGAGTLVQTLAGPRPIEGLKVGDRVLTQSTRDGALAYRPVLVVHHNPPSPTFEVKVRGDTIVASPFHRFWVVGKGWVMARELKGDETLRLLGGPARIESVSAGQVQPVFNLDVADDHDFFAGAVAALVHDNTLPDTRLEPFDAVRDLAALTESAAKR